MDNMENKNDEITFGEKIDLFKQLKELHSKVQTVHDKLVDPNSGKTSTDLLKLMGLK